MFVIRWLVVQKFVVVLNLPAILNLIWPGHTLLYAHANTTTSVEHSIVTMLHSTRIIFSTYSFKKRGISQFKWRKSTHYIDRKPCYSFNPISHGSPRHSRRSYLTTSVFAPEVAFIILQHTSNVCVPNNPHIIYTCCAYRPSSRV